MRQSKYRGISKDLNKWVYGSLITTPHGVFILEGGDSIEFREPDYHSVGMGCGLEDRNITDRYEAMRHGFEQAVERFAELYPRFIEVDPESVGVYFGWIDSMGTEIYTGDQLELFWNNGDTTCETISYSQEYGYFMYGNNPVCELTEGNVKSKVVGNIHELLNPPKEGVLNMTTDPGAKQTDQEAGVAEEAKADTANEQAGEQEIKEEGNTEG